MLRIVLMDVSGCGKSSRGTMLSARLAERMATRRDHSRPLSLRDRQFVAHEAPAADEAPTAVFSQPLRASVEAMPACVQGPKP